MQRKLYTLIITAVMIAVSLVGCAWGSVSLSAFPDPVFREVLKRYDEGWTEYDSDGEPYTVGRDDGFLGDREIERIEVLYLFGVTSLNGWQYLTSLTELQLKLEGITLDTLNFSGCTVLTYLDLNYQSSVFDRKNNQVTKLDVSGCTALTSLKCSYTQLKELNVSNCTALTELWCYNNQLTELDVSGCTALTYLNCQENQLTKLDVNECSALTNLYCYNNQLTELDVSGCTALTYLNCQENQLTKLDVNECSALTNLYCYNNQLTELSLSDCTALETLNCARNQLTELDLSHNTALHFNYNSNGCLWQKARDLKVKKTSKGHYEINMKDYVSRLEHIEYADIDYNTGTGIATVGCPIASVNYGYNTGLVISGKGIIMPVKVTNALSITPIERYGSETYGIICDMTDNSYLDQNGNALTESEIHDYNYSDYGKLGLAADGNSRLILRVETDKPGIASFSLNDDIGAKLESLTSRAEISASDRISTTKLFGYDPLFETYQVSAVLVAPESFPKNKNFPSDTFKVHVKFTDEDGEVAEGDVELTIAAAPVLLIPGMFDNADETFGISRNTGVWYSLMYDKFDETHVDFWDYDGSKGPNELLANDYNDLFKKLNGMFGQYASAGIVCTKADIVAHGMGGLMARKFLTSGSKDSDDGNNWAVSSYRQGMVHKLITVATPHRGTPWADTPDRSSLITTLYNAVLSSPFYGDHPGWEYVLKPFTFMVHTMFPSPQIFQDAYLTRGSAWSELKTTEPRSYGFPAKVPMFAIAGNTAADSLVNDVWTLTTTLVDKTLNVNINVYDMPLCLLSNVGHILEALNRIGVVARNAVLKGKIASVAKGIGVIGLIYDMPSYAKVFTDAFALSLFGNSGHDVMVSTQSATHGISNEIFTNTGKEALSKEKNGRYSHWSICQQIDVGVTVVSLLKDKHPSLYQFTVFDTETPEGTGASMLAAADNRVLEIVSDDFEFNETLRLNVKPREFLSPTTSQTVRFTVVAPKKLTEDVYCTIGSGDVCRFFKLIDADGTGRKFQAELNARNLLVSVDAGVLDVQCFSLIPDNSGMYTSNTMKVGWLTNTVSEDEDIVPTITTSKLSNGVRKKSYSLQLKASGTTPIIWTHTGELPAGLKLSTSGKISGTPTKAGSYTFTVKAENAAGESSKKFTLKVTQTTITGTVPTASTCKAAFTATIKASNGTSPYKWSISGGKIPDGLTLNTETGVIAGSPTTAGKFSFTVKAKDKNGVTATKTYTVTVTQTKISGTVSSTATRKGTFTSTLKAIGGAEPYTWSISEGALPNGLKLGEATGKITGSPTKAGKFTFTVKVVDKNGAAATKAYTVKVTQTTISGTIPSTATRKSKYAGTLTATNGAKPYTWSISKGELPDGLKLNETTGKITGSPTKAGKFTFTVKAVDKNKVAATKACTVKITQTTITGSILTAVSVKAPYSSALKAEGGASPYTWSVSSGKLPNGLTIKKEIGEISGTPTQAGSYTFTVKAVDKNKAASTKSFTVKITEPTISGTFKGGVVKAKYTSGTATVSGGTAPYTWTSTGTLPTGMTLKFSGAKATLSGTPKKAETFTFTLKATDKNGAVVSKKYTVKITQPTISGTFKNGVVKAKYTSGTATVSGGTAPYTWTSTGTLPTGMTLNFSGAKATLSGTPKKAGSFTFTLKATDKNGAAASNKYTVKITKTEASSKEESQTDVKEETSTLEISDGITSLPNIEGTVPSEDGTATFTPSLLLRVESEDIVESYDGKDSDMVKVKANRPLHFIVNVTDVVVYVDDQAVENVTVSGEGKFTLPAELIHDDFKVSAKSGEQESEEVYIIAE